MTKVDAVGQAHVDTNLPHRAVLFEAAEEEATKAFEPPTSGYQNWYVEGKVV